MRAVVCKIVQQDVAWVCQELGKGLEAMEGSTWLISGCAGFLGSYFLDFLHYCNETMFARPCTVLCLENFKSGRRERIKHLENDKHLRFVKADVVKPFQVRGKLDYIVHAASIASPAFYRKYPIETIEANVLGLRNLLELARDKDLRGFLFFSSSEVYGDPSPENIPTPEQYNGNVSCTGPRACYDESKRLGETLAVNYHGQYGVPVKIVRPFNIYGPGLRLEDRRVLPDFFQGALFNQRITILSDGTPTRSFCYVRDALTGFIRALLSNYNGEAFNVGNEEAEISIAHLAELVAELVGDVQIEFGISQEAEYLTDNPQRRCPDLTKAKTLLDYRPQVDIREGLARSLDWYREEYRLEEGEK